MKIITSLSPMLVAIALAACGSSGTSNPPASDAATTSDVAATPASVATALCAASRRQMCTTSMTCETDVAMVFSGVSASCITQRDAYLRCALPNAATTPCAMITMGMVTGCTAQATALEACASPPDGGSVQTDASDSDSGMSTDDAATEEDSGM